MDPNIYSQDMNRHSEPLDCKKNEQVVKYKETHLWERSPEERAGSTYSFSSPNFRLHIILSWAGSNMMSSPWMLLKRPFLLTENLIAPTWFDSYLKRSFLRHSLSGTECTQAGSRAPPPSFHSQVLVKMSKYLVFK